MKIFDRSVERVRNLLPQRPSPPRSPRDLIAAAAGGALLAFFLDPSEGRRRRRMTADRVAGTVRRSLRRAERTGRRAGAEAYGIRQKVAHRKEEEREFDDVTLARKVESELFADQSVPKGSININVEHGIVVLRGEVDRPGEIRRIERATRKINGVYSVRNLLHLPNTPAPTA